jgi:4-amino-4-deoxy-L-arabinose transferase-like glycosyltransferase
VDDKFIEKNEVYILAAVILIFTLPRIPYLLQESLWNDETVYMWMSNQISRDPGFLLTSNPAHHSYGYVFSMLAAVMDLLMPAFYSTRILTLLFSIMTGVLLYHMGKKAGGYYVGIAGAILLGFNALHIFITDRALLDVPLTAMMTAVVAALMYFKPDDVRSGMILGATALVSAFTKTSGLLAIPIIGISLVLRYPSLKDLKKKGVLACLGVLLASGLILMGNNLVLFSRLTSEPVSAFTSAYFSGSDPGAYLQQLGFIYTAPIFALALLGIYLSFTENKELQAASVMVLFYFLFFSFVVGEKVPRYVLPTVPATILLATYAAAWAIKKFELPNYAVLAILVLAYFSYQPTPALLQQRSLTYTGFQELGAKVAELDESQHFETIYAQSERQIRAFSGIDYKSDGGRISRLPENLTALENETNVLMEIDVWEYTGPGWAYPLDQEKLNAIIAANFTLAHVVSRDYPTDQGMQEVPVGFLFVKS